MRACGVAAQIKYYVARYSTVVAMLVKQLVVVALKLLLIQVWWCDACWEDERLALMQLQNTFSAVSGEGYAFFHQGSPWGKSGNCCEWKGIVCDTDTERVIALDLLNARDSGDWYLNASLFLPFKHLNYLILGMNGIIGCLQNEGFEKLKSLSNLEHLDLSENNFTNNILPSLSALSSLKSLTISYNKLKGLTHFEELAALRNLEELRLSGNEDISEFVASKDLCNLSYLQLLDLSSNNLNGELPQCLANFTSLQYLHLSNNSLVGNISSSPLTQMTSVRRLNLEKNNFRIPISLLPFYNLSNLYDLFISHNELYAEIELHNLIPKFQLEGFELFGDGCGGFIPKFLYHQHNLQFVSFEDTKMQGEFPHWLFENNTKLRHLSLSSNFFSGSIILPSHSHMNLFSLRISNNAFSGQIPKKIGSYFPNLELLCMSNNELNGSIPSSIGNLRTLLSLDFSNNDLSGEIPSLIGSMEFLRTMDISGNKISGKLPIFFGTLSLTEVYLSKNMIHGSFLRAFHNCTQLQTLDLSHNFLTDMFLRWPGNFSQLQLLFLGHNRLEGEIITEMCSWDQLSFIDLSNNNLFGHIPTCLMYNYRYRRNQGYSTYPGSNEIVMHQQPVGIVTKNISLLYEGRILNLISGIDLSYNNLIGEIPLELGNLNHIRLLNLSHNKLTGAIPPTLSNLGEIESLDLSYNNLEGNIPTQLTRLTFLSFFSVAHNNLSGRTPERVNQFGNFDNGSYVGNPFLCGEPLSRSCTPKPHLVQLVPTTSNEKNNEYIDMGTFYVVFTVTYTIVLSGIAAVLYINPYWRRDWFFFIERKMEDWYYFIMYYCPRFFRSKFSKNNT